MAPSAPAIARLPIPPTRSGSAEATTELKRQRAHEAALSLRAERLRAFVLDRAADFSAGRDFPGLVAAQQAILDLQNEARASQRQVLLSRAEVSLSLILYSPWL